MEKETKDRSKISDISLIDILEENMYGKKQYIRRKFAYIEEIQVFFQIERALQTF